jgi:DNA polymerase I-like protein with 3'-5' exonuclease and polymerase domains
MSAHTKVETAIIKDFQGSYFAAFPAHKMWHAYVAQVVKSAGHHTTFLGMRRHFFGRRDDPATIRAAIAFEPQSVVGELLNRGMLNVWRLNKVQLLLQVHDAIVFQYPEEGESEILPLIVGAIIIPVELRHGRTLTIPCDVQSGWNWDSFSNTNPDGLRDWNGHDQRVRSNPYSSQLDCLLSGRDGRAA